MTPKNYLSLFLIFFANIIYAQVGIGTTSPNSSLDIRSTNQASPSNTDGIIIPKIDVFPVTNPTVAQQGMLVYLTTAVGANQPGFYYWDNGSTSWTGIASGVGNEKDWYKEGTTSAPDDITDDMFHIGNVAIGKNTTNFPLEVNTTAFDKGIVNTFSSTATNGNDKYASQNELTIDSDDETSSYRTDISGAGNGDQYGSYTSQTGTGTGNHFGGYNALTGTGNGQQYGIYNQINNIGTGNHLGIANVMSGSGNGTRWGISNLIADTGTGDHYGVANSLNGPGNGLQYGVQNTINNTGSGNHLGTINNLLGTGTGIQYATYNAISNAGNNIHYGTFSALGGIGTGDHYGARISITGSGTGIQYGTNNEISNSGAGIHYGSYNNLIGSGAGAQYANYNSIYNTGNGTHYGNYNDLNGTGTGTQYGNYTTISNTGGGTQYGNYSVLTGNGVRVILEIIIYSQEPVLVFKPLLTMKSQILLVLHISENILLFQEQGRQQNMVIT